MGKWGILVFLVMGTACVNTRTSNRVTIESTKHRNVDVAKVFTLPVLADLDISKKKRRAIVRTRKSNQYSRNTLIKELKRNALIKLAKKNSADLIVEPRYKTEIVEENNIIDIVVEVTGWPASYKNFRQVTHQEAEKLSLISESLGSSAQLKTVTAAQEKTEIETTRKRFNNDFRLSTGLGMASSEYVSGLSLSVDAVLMFNPYIGIGIDLGIINMTVDQSGQEYYDPTYGFANYKEGTGLLLIPSFHAYIPISQVEIGLGVGLGGDFAYAESLSGQIEFSFNYFFLEKLGVGFQGAYLFDTQNLEVGFGKYELIASFKL